MNTKLLPWCVVTETRHSGESHSSERYATEAEAHSAAMAEREKYHGSGVWFRAGLHWDEEE